MNCLEFRRVCQAAPHDLSREARAHMSECPACARFAERQLDFDRRLATALRVEAPEGLTANVIFERSHRGRRRFTWLAAAAVVALAASGVLGLSLYPAGQPGFGARALAHMEDHPLATMPAEPDAARELARLGGDLGFDLDPGSAAVARAKLCDVDGHRGAHFVLEDGGMRATAFVMPGLTAADTGLLERAGMQGLVVQTEQGVIAVFCPDRERLLALGEKLREAVRWSSA